MNGYKDVKYLMILYQIVNVQWRNYSGLKKYVQRWHNKIVIIGLELSDVNDDVKIIMLDII